VLGRVLIIEDEVVLAKWLARLLGKSFDVLTVFSGQDGLDAWVEKGPFDVVLCDLMLPVVSGMQVHRKLQSLAPGSEDRIVFMTGGAFTHATESFLENITNPRLEKPFDVPTLLATVERVARNNPL
jgi:DNA-binding response OmpR family regulator